MKESLVLDNKFDKKIAGIIRWLERLKKSYSSGAMENALMDAECARADLENLRLDVWATLDPQAKSENKIFSRILNFARVSSLAAIIVLLAVFPISKEIQAPAVIEHEKEKITLAQPIIIVRENKENKNDNNIEAVEVKPELKAKKPARPANIKKIAQEKSQTQIQTAKNEPEQKTIAYDKVFSLMQTGERALKNNRSVIKSN